MNIFKRVFTSISVANKNNKPENQDGEIKAKRVLEELLSRTSKEVIKFQIHHQNDIENTSSRIGGLPYIPIGEKIPSMKDGKQLIFLAQINCKELPKNSMYPQKGMLQFWIFGNDLYGLDFDDMTSNNTFRVIYFEDIVEAYSVEESREIYIPYLEKEYSSVVDSGRQFGMSFIVSREGMSIGTFGFEEQFLEIWNEIYPTKTVEDFMDLPYGVEDLIYNNDCEKVHHCIGGYPYFTQADPRESEKYSEYTELLLQIDSEQAENNEWNIIWGDVGVCNFFITKQQLKNKDFSKVMYNWDCC